MKTLSIVGNPKITVVHDILENHSLQIYDNILIVYFMVYTLSSPHFVGFDTHL